MGAAGTPTFRSKGGGGTPTGPAGGDLTGFYPNPTLVATGVVPATYGDSTHWPQIIVDGKGRITFAQNIAATGGSGGVIVEDEGTPLGTATTLDFVGAGVTVTFLAGVATITIPGGGGGGADCTTAPTLMCLAGRTGATNNPTISSDASGTLTGSSVSGSNLIVHSNASLDGYTEFDGNVRIKNNFAGNGGIIGGVNASSLQLFGLDISTATSITGPNAIRAIFVDLETLSSGLTITDAAYAPLLVCNGNMNIAATTGEASIFGVIASGQATITDSTQHVLVGLFSSSMFVGASGTTQTLSLGNVVEGAIQYFAGSSGNLTVDRSIVFWDNTGTNNDGSGSVTVTDHSALMTAPSVANGTTITDRYGLWFRDYQSSAGVGEGVITNETAILIDELNNPSSHPSNPPSLTLSIRSIGAAVEMRHAGPAVFGADAAPTGAYILEAIGSAHVSGKLTVDGVVDPTQLILSKGTTSPLIDLGCATNVGSNGNEFTFINQSNNVNITGSFATGVGLGFENDWVLAESSGTVSCQAYFFDPNVKNAVGANLGAFIYGGRFEPSIIADTNIFAVSYYGVAIGGVFKVTNGGSHNSVATGFYTNISVDSGTTLGTHVGVDIDFSKIGSGVITESSGLVIRDLTAATTSYSIRSLGNSPMRHVGAAVFGADADPTGAYKLECIGDAHVSGNLAVDGSSYGTVYGSSAASKYLNLEGSSTTQPAMLVNVGRKETSWSSPNYAVFNLLPSDMTVDTPMQGYSFGDSEDGGQATWTLSNGAIISMLVTNVIMTNSTAASATFIGTNIGPELHSNFPGNNMTWSKWQGFLHAPITTAGVNFTEITAVDDAPVVAGSASVATTRRTVWSHAGLSSSHQTNYIGFDGGDEGASTLAVTFRSAMNSGTGKWGYQHTGTANNAFVGSTVFGANAVPTNSSVGLEVQSTTLALLLSRMTTTQRDALTAVNGMVIYNSTTDKFQGYENGSWTNLI